jgi:excisionase family DNA binding protein
VSDDRLLEAAEVAELLRVPVSWVRQETRAGRMPAVQLGRYWRYRQARILEWVDGLETNGARSSPRKHMPKGVRS